MAYQALYRVWRSQRFDDLVGQEAITKTLKNAIQQQKLPTPIYLPAPAEQENQCGENFCQSHQLSQQCRWGTLQ